MIVIRSAAELDALPVGSVVMEGGSGEPQPWVFGVSVMPGVWHRFPDGWYVVAGHGARTPEFDLGPLTVLYRPDVAEVRAQAAQQTLDSYRITDAVRDVAYERATHAERGWTPEHDAEHGVNHLERLAIERLGFVPQDRGELVKAASLLIAAIELIDRQEADHG